jgi:hypothetical protein
MGLWISSFWMDLAVGVLWNRPGSSTEEPSDRGRVSRCFVTEERLQRCSVCDLAKIFFTSKFSYLLFVNPNIKTNTGISNRCGTTNSKPLGPIIIMSQSETLSSSEILYISKAPWVHPWAFHWLHEIFILKRVCHRLEPEWEMQRIGWGDRRGALCTRFTLVIFNTLFSSGVQVATPFTSHYTLCNYAEPKPFSWIQFYCAGSNTEHCWRCSNRENLTCRCTRQDTQNLNLHKRKTCT